MARKRSTRRKKGQKITLPKISLDQALDYLGYALLTVTVLTLLSFLSANHGVIPRWWVGVLRSGFGWGAYLTPLFIGAAGLWLVLRTFQDRLPQVTLVQVLGALLGYLLLLTTLHFLSAALQFGGDLRATARAGSGGGALGGALSRALLAGLGGVGVVVALIALWLIVPALTFGYTIKDAEQLIQMLAARVPRRQAISDEHVRVQPLPLTTSDDRPPVQAASEPSEDADFLPVISQATPANQTAAATDSAIPRPRMIGSEQRWVVPAVSEILEPGGDQDVSADILRMQARTIEETLESLGAPVRVVEINRGPVVTQFGVEPLVVKNQNGRETKVKVSRINNLSHDLALALEARTLRIEAPIPGKGLVGIEVPNPQVSLVALRDVMESETYVGLDSLLKLCLGQDVSGRPVVADLTAMPHLLIAGTTGSGKSVCINSIIAAFLMQRTPDELKFLMIDPKRVELTGYNGIPHLTSKVVVEMERVTGALKWVLREMDSRYRHFADVRATHIRDFNERVAPTRGERPLPYIVVIIDELADMMMMAPQETERSICRIAQMARATGIHLVVATQRPSVNVVTGLIKANFPARIAFNVASSVDSRVILDMPGAEQLLGQGDMLFLPPNIGTPLRLQGAYVSNYELRHLVNYWTAQGKPISSAAERPIQPPLWEERSKPAPAHAEVEFEDELLPEVVDLVIHENRASISLLQRKLRIGYTRAARLMDILEQHAVVGPQPSGGQAREVFPRAGYALLHPDAESSKTVQ
ncbi:MAG: DNA translocase FtsK [Chloroflexi bacterium]|nr:DNA translocase FtsK [Chloroflexota bacterium]